MSTPVTDAPVVAGDDPTAPPDYRRRRRFGAAVLALVVVIVGAAAFAWWDTHLNLVRYDKADTHPDVSGPIPLGKELTHGTEVFANRGDGQGTGPDLRVTVDSIRPDIVTNTSDATIVMRLCVGMVTPRLEVGDQYGENLSSLCHSVVPVNGQSVQLGPPGAQVVAFITPHRAGVVRINGWWVSYRKGARHRTQRGGDNTVWTTR